MEAKRIYIADDDDNIRDAIKIFLENDGYDVTAFANGDLLLKAFENDSCDLVILDVMMPGSDGFTICRELRGMSTVPIIMLTARDTDFDYAKGISLGSDDYFTKPFSPTALVMRVKAIFRRIEFEKQNQHSVSKEEPLSYGNIKIDCAAKRVTAAGGEIDLTPNEYGMLEYMIRNADRAVSRDELLEHVWDCRTDIETRATDDTARRLRKKLEPSDVIIDAVWGYGFRLKCRELKNEEK